MAGLALAAALAWSVTAGPCEVREDDPDRRPGTVLQEDDPGWDCSTMGNRRCAP